MRGDLEQGQIVKVEDCDLFLNCPCILVVTHSCDIINTKEPFIEVLPCHKLDKVDGENVGGRNQRTLDFSLQGSHYRVFAYEKTKIKKEDHFLDGSNSQPMGKIDSLNMFQSWLASRYNRQTLPDCVNDFLKKTLRLKDVARHCGQALLQIWLYLDNASGQEDNIISAYEMQLYFILDSEAKDYEQLKNYITQKEDGIKKELDAHQLPRPSFETEIRGDDDISYKELRGLVAFNLDYLSYKK